MIQLFHSGVSNNAIFFIAILKVVDVMKTLAFLLISISAFNIADYIFTERAISWGIEEANPWVLLMMETGYYPFLKIGLVSFLLLGIWYARFHFNNLSRAIIFGLWLTFVSYFAVTVWHIYGQFF